MEDPFATARLSADQFNELVVQANRFHEAAAAAQARNDELEMHAQLINKFQTQFILLNALFASIADYALVTDNRINGVIAQLRTLTNSIDQALTDPTPSDVVDQLRADLDTVKRAVDEMTEQGTSSRPSLLRLFSERFVESAGAATGNAAGYAAAGAGAAAALHIGLGQ